ncbi:MAG TPA: prepilin peptidase [Candidatus Limnocylindria bacterium]|jgi:prepilin signal peptidase PulO-like enzyme (type II secretory pathway)|nr:prepilin peptidase [Candidatus Limnocylindria bacterium]
MTQTITVTVTTITFAMLAWAGSRLADALSKNFTPHADGPSPVAFPRWPFAAVGALLGLTASLRDATPVHLTMEGVVLFALAACTACDLRVGMLPDVCTLGPLVLLLGLAALQHDWAPPLGAALIGTPFAATALVSRGLGMGWGDVKLAALGGALLGAPNAALAFTFAAFAAYLIAWRTGGLRRPIAFGPYLAVSIAAAGALGKSS